MAGAHACWSRWGQWHRIRDPLLREGGSGPGGTWRCIPSCTLSPGPSFPLLHSLFPAKSFFLSKHTHWPPEWPSRLEFLPGPCSRWTPLPFLFPPGLPSSPAVISVFTTFAWCLQLTKSVLCRRIQILCTRIVDIQFTILKKNNAEILYCFKFYKNAWLSQHMARLGGLLGL